MEPRERERDSLEHFKKYLMVFRVTLSGIPDFNLSIVMDHHVIVLGELDVLQDIVLKLRRCMTDSN